MTCIIDSQSSPVTCFATSFPTVCSSVTSPFDVHYLLTQAFLDVLRKVVPRLRHVTSLDYESCQLVQHHCISFASQVHKQASGPFLLVHYDV